MPAQGTILVVDDDREIVRGTMVRLASAGYKPIAAYDGLEAMQRINHDHPDAMLLDVRMPGLDGLGVLEHMRESTEMSKLPVIMLSASLRDQNKALNAGARYFLPKPYRGEDLLQALRGVLPDSPSAAGPSGGARGPAEGATAAAAQQAAARPPVVAPQDAAPQNVGPQNVGRQSPSALAADARASVERRPAAEAPPPAPSAFVPWSGPESGLRFSAAVVDQVMCAMTSWIADLPEGFL